MESLMHSYDAVFSRITPIALINCRAMRLRVGAHLNVSGFSSE